MKKYTIFTFIMYLCLLSSPNFTQENETKQSSWRGNYSKYIPSLTFKAPYVSIYTRLEGISDKAFVSTTGLEWMGGNSIYYYGQLRFSHKITGSGVLPNNIQQYYSPNKVGLLHGLGGYLFDFRGENKIGWSMVMNGGIGLDIAIPDQFELNGSVANLFTIVTEINTYARYHFSPKAAVQIGLNIGIDISLSQLPSSKIQVETPFRYGLGIGFAF